MAYCVLAEMSKVEEFSACENSWLEFFTQTQITSLIQDFSLSRIVISSKWKFPWRLFLPNTLDMLQGDLTPWEEIVLHWSLLFLCCWIIYNKQISFGYIVKCYKTVLKFRCGVLLHLSKCLVKWSIWLYWPGHLFPHILVL